MPIALFIDGSFVRKIFAPDNIDYLKLRTHIEAELNDSIDEAYYFDADDDPPRATQFHNALAYPPPTGPGLRLKIYWLTKKRLSWPMALGGAPVMHPTNPNLQYEITQQKAVDVGISFHLIRSHSKRKWTKLVFASGDGDFHEPIQSLVEQENVDLYLVGAISSISQELRPYARRIFEIDKAPLHQTLKR